jgi:NitT/TauT family transport system substrate-binding protein
VLPLDQVLPGFGFGLILYNREWARRNPQEARRWMIAYVKGLRYYNEAFDTSEGRNDLIAIMTARTSIKDRTVWDRMSWPGLDPDGNIDMRSLLDHQRWLLNEHLISQFVLPDRLVDLSYVREAAKILGPHRGRSP